jgi:hypothetical protein
MTSNDTVNDFLNYISNDINGSININYNNYINTIDGLINNGTFEIEQYNNYINNSQINFPNIQQLNNIAEHCKKDHSENYRSHFSSHIWLYVYH